MTGCTQVVLVGTMGAGKTTVGRSLAERWGVGFRDTDQDVEAAEGRSVSDIFVDSGEAAFRALERPRSRRRWRARRRAGARRRRGARRGDPRSCWPDTGWCSCGSGLSDAAQRVGLGVSRPLLLGNVRGRIKQLIDERTPVYESVATHVVDTDGLSVREVVERGACRGRG